MIEAFAFVIAQVASQPQPVDAESLAVTEVFREACTLGALKLPRSRGRIIEENDLPRFAEVLDPWAGWKNQTFIELKHPKSTYVIIADLKDPQPKSIARRCIVVSRVISKRAAATALVESTPNIEPRQTWIPAIYLPEWTVDLPEQGYRKRLVIKDDGTVLLEVGTYTTALNQPDLKAERQ